MIFVIVINMFCFCMRLFINDNIMMGDNNTKKNVGLCVNIRINQQKINDFNLYVLYVP